MLFDGDNLRREWNEHLIRCKKKNCSKYEFQNVSDSSLFWLGDL